MTASKERILKICEYCGKSCDIEITEKNNHYINVCEKCFDRKKGD